MCVCVCYLLTNSLLVKISNEPEFIYLHTAKWFYVLLSDTNSVTFSVFSIPNDEYENFVNALLEEVAECIPTKQREKGV